MIFQGKDSHVRISSILIMSSIRDSASFWGKKLEISDEETVEAERPRRNRTFLVIFLWSSLISLLFLSLLMLGPYFLNVVVIHNGSGAETPFTARAPTTGNQYLLGVGKADITGFVHYSTQFEASRLLTQSDLLWNSISWATRA